MTRDRFAAAAIRIGALVGGALAATLSPSARSEDASPSPEVASRPMNRLAGEASPYLQLHAHNPVDWYPWGDEALARARAESKPIFLSIGYSTCYWCHVMERKVFSDPEIAALMNRYFISIKVDREERPDLDEIYMTATHLLTGSGGWPNSVFLTPEGEPFYAGTYFPPEDTRGRPGFPRVLRQLADRWENDRERVRDVARQLAAAISSNAAASASAPTSRDPGELLGRALADLSRSYEPQHGGFAARTKFPNPALLELLLAAREPSADSAARAMLTHTLDEMALGGIYDHLGGGFHRYATEPTWSVPHFEKMLYDNAQLLGIYARAHAATGRALYRHVVEDVARYLEREMTHPDGGFYSAQDAQVDGEEGASYVWTQAEIEAVLGAERAAAFLAVYQLAPLHGSRGGVLRLRLPFEPALERLDLADVTDLIARFEPDRAKLLRVRSGREQPLRDEKVLTAWNGLAIRGLVDAATVLERPEYVRRAERSARFVLGRLRAPDGRLRRSYVAGQVREEAVLDDYAFLADGLLALHEFTGDAEWLDAARALADRMLADYEDRDGAGFFLTRTGTDLLVRPRRVQDRAEPSGNGIALRVLRELAARTGDARYAEAAERTTAAFGALFDRAPSSVGTAVAALNHTPRAGVAAPTRVAVPAAPRRAPLPRSEDHVQVSLRRRGDSSDRFIVQVKIDDGWHINANPASRPFLIPTTVDGEDGVTVADVRYPAGRPFHPRFSPEALSVYEQTIEIPTSVARGDSSPARLLVRYQACDSERCLPPGTSRVELP